LLSDFPPWIRHKNENKYTHAKKVCRKIRNKNVHNQTINTQYLPIGGKKMKERAQQFPIAPAFRIYMYRYIQLIAFSSRKKSSLFQNPSETVTQIWRNNLQSIIVDSTKGAQTKEKYLLMHNDGPIDRGKRDSLGTLEKKLSFDLI
jgi:hypothetical protein